MISLSIHTKSIKIYLRNMQGNSYIELHINCINVTLHFVWTLTSMSMKACRKHIKKKIYIYSMSIIYNWHRIIEYRKKYIFYEYNIIENNIIRIHRI